MGGSQSVPTVKEDLNKNRPNMVIIPVDQSKQAEAAFMWYVRHIHKEGNTVQILHCTEWPPMHKVTSAETAQEGFKRSREEGKQLIETYQQKLAEHQVPGSVHFEFGNAGECVVRAADRFKACQIVMGSRGFGMVRRTFLGSVSDYVIHHSKIPVTVVPKETQSWFF